MKYLYYSLGALFVALYVIPLFFSSHVFTVIAMTAPATQPPPPPPENGGDDGKPVVYTIPVIDMGSSELGEVYEFGTFDLMQNPVTCIIIGDKPSCFISKQPVAPPPAP